MMIIMMIMMMIISKLSKAEQKKMMADGLAVAFKSFDTDNDGD